MTNKKTVFISIIIAVIVIVGAGAYFVKNPQVCETDGRFASGCTCIGIEKTITADEPDFLGATYHTMCYGVRLNYIAVE